MKKLALLAFTLFSAWNMDAKTITGPVDYVSPLVGTQSKHALSTGNTYPAIALPWGMNFWVPQTGKMGDGWAYTYDADKIRGFKQTHQPSPWINDYGQFSIMPITGKAVFDQDFFNRVLHLFNCGHFDGLALFQLCDDLVRELFRRLFRFGAAAGVKSF